MKVGTLFGLTVLISGLALGARRLHDINKSGWWLLMSVGIFLIVPVIVLIVRYTKPSDERTSKYDPDPQQATSQ
ncbi:hypothetical protein CMK12_07750 [Candidatus Poribacteria bacterium]|nr:hypothetical protein [Candidatus Poribacteria bacterium]